MWGNPKFSINEIQKEKCPSCVAGWQAHKDEEERVDGGGMRLGVKGED
jgi:hypothetical protein